MINNDFCKIYTNYINNNYYGSCGDLSIIMDPFVKKYGNQLNYNSKEDILSLPIYFINNNYYICSDMFSFIDWTCNNIIEVYVPTNNHIDIVEVIKVLNNTPSCLKEINNGIFMYYIPLHQFLCKYITNPNISELEFMNTIENIIDPQKYISSNYKFYKKIKPIIIEKNLNADIDNLNDKINSLIKENKKLNAKIRNLELDIHYLKLENPKKIINYDYNEIKNRNKQLNNEFKRIYKLISKKI